MKLGEYELLAEIGRGGMGAVHRARAADGREVAVKVLFESDAEAAQAFDRERRLLASFAQADGFVPFLDSGSDGRRRWVVMPLVRGGTLRERLRWGRLPWEEAVALAVAVATALGRAHDRGIVHRDLKPENVLFAEDGSGHLQPLVADLGLAKHFRRDVLGASGSHSLSDTGDIVGTAGYMAPEQLEDSKNVGPPCDVFALGVLLHECLSGERPFRGDTVDPKKAFESRPRALPGTAPRWLGAILRSMLALDPLDRFPDGHAAARALAAGAPRSRGKLALVPLVVLGVAGVALAVALAARRKPPGPPPTEVADAPPAPASGVQGAQRQAIVLVVRAQEELSRDDTEGALADATAAAFIDRTCAPAWSLLAATHEALRDDPGAVADATRAIELDPAAALAWRVRAAARGSQGDLEGEIADGTRAIELAPDVASAWWRRGAARLAKRDYDGAIADADHAIELDPRVAGAFAIRGTARARKGDLEGSISDLSRALEIRPDYAEALRLRARTRILAKDTLGARADFERYLELAPRSSQVAEIRDWLDKNR
jgi:tetratricopeptide (TPR) repeat protein